MAGESLRILSGPAAGQVLPINGDFTIGRAERGAGGLGGDSDISRQHARVYEYAPGMLAIQDLGSTNGTYVNGQPLAAPRVLAPGDQVQVGKTVLRYEAVPPSSPVGAPAAPSPGALALGAGTPQPAPGRRPRPSSAGRSIALIGIPLLIVAGVVIAIVASSGGGGASDGGAPSPTAAVMTFYADAARGDSSAACDLLAPDADQRDAPADLLVAGTGTIIAKTSECTTTLDAFYKPNPGVLQGNLAKIHERATSTTGTRSDVVISRAGTTLTYTATVVKSGPGWKIAAVKLG